MLLFLNDGGSGRSLNASQFHTFKLKCLCVSGWMNDIPARWNNLSSHSGGTDTD